VCNDQVSLSLAGDGHPFHREHALVLALVVRKDFQGGEGSELAHPRGYQLDAVLWPQDADGDGVVVGLHWCVVPLPCFFFLLNNKILQCHVPCFSSSVATR